MNPQSFARMSEIKVVGIPLRTKYEDIAISREIGNFWQKFYEEKVLDRIPHKSLPHRIIALYADYDKEGNCVLILGAQVTQYDLETIPNGMVFKTVPAAHYALFLAQGPAKQIVPDLWKTIWADKKLQRTYSFDFELYDVPVDVQNATVSIYVGVHGKL